MIKPLDRSMSEQNMCNSSGIHCILQKAAVTASEVIISFILD